MLGTLHILLKAHDEGETEQMGLGKERSLGSWWEGGVWETPAKGEGHSLVSLQALFAILGSSQCQQPFKWEEAEMGAKGQVSPGRRKKVSKSRDQVDTVAFVGGLELGGC